MYRTRSINEYFGDDGFGMFVVGTYAADQTSAGMVGYVQTENSQAWLDRLTRGFVRRTVSFEFVSRFEPRRTIKISHQCKFPGTNVHTSGRIDIYHLLLEFL